MEFYKTQLGKILNEVKLAYLSQIPIVYIPTEQQELIEELVYSEKTVGAIIPRFYKEEYIPMTNSDRLCVNYYWNISKQLREKETKYKTPSFFVFVDKSLDGKCKLLDSVEYLLSIRLHKHLPDEQKYVSRDISSGICRSLIIINTPKEEKVPDHLAPYTSIVRVPPLVDEEIENVIQEVLKEFEIESEIVCKDGLLKQMVVNMRGFSVRRIKALVRRMVYEESFLITGTTEKKKAILNTIRLEKKEVLNNISGLKWEDINDGYFEACGMGNIKNWVKEYKETFADIRKAEINHEDIPKGILVSGIPGSGKSLMAKTVAQEFGVPLISLDMGAMRGSLHGESENNMIHALKVAEDMSPCVLWVDEIEKAFSGSSNDSGQGDHGVSRRLFGKFLTWLQEKKSACFVFATANDITHLPPELFRAERFSKKFFSFLPTAEECAQIFVSQIKMVNKAYEENLKTIAVELKEDMPRTLFDEEVDKEEFWVEIFNELNNEKCEEIEFGVCRRSKLNNDDINKNSLLRLRKLEDALGWKNKDGEMIVLPRVKMYSGADITSILKEIKHRIHQLHRSGYTKNMVKYSKRTVEYVAKEVMRNYKSYGETNLKDIVKCYLTLAENQFEPASANCQIRLDYYDEDCMRYGSLSDELEKSFVNMYAYDKGLYQTIISAINHYTPILKQEKRTML